MVSVIFQKKIRISLKGKNVKLGNFSCFKASQVFRFMKVLERHPGSFKLHHVKLYHAEEFKRLKPNIFTKLNPCN